MTTRCLIGVLVAMASSEGLPGDAIVFVAPAHEARMSSAAKTAVVVVT